MIFFASIQEALSTISLRPRSAALSLIVRAGGAKGLGTEGSDKKSSRTEIAELTSGCARGAKAGAGVPEEDIGRACRVGEVCTLPPPTEKGLCTESPPPIDLTPLPNDPLPW